MINTNLLSIGNIIAIGMMLLFLAALLWGAAELTNPAV